MKNLFQHPASMVKTKLKKRLAALKSLSSLNNNAQVSANQKTFMKECSNWLEKIITNYGKLKQYLTFSLLDLKDKSLFNEFRLTESGDIFKGEGNTDYSNGYGISFMSNGDLVEGKFVNGSLCQGMARILYNNGEFYTGQVSQFGSRNGQGVYYYSNGDIYDGQFVDGKRIGSSRLRFKDNSEYIGQFIDDQADGNGIYTDKHGNRFMTVSHDHNDPSFEGIKNGFFLRGRLYGLGEIIFKNGDLYKGQFKGTKRDGYGEMKYLTPVNGLDISELGEYKGHWRQDKRDGYGKMEYMNNCEFKGNWQNDQKHYGEFTFQDGSIYHGNFKNNQFDGYGKISIQRGLIIEGVFKNGEIGPTGTITFTNGNVFTGEIVDQEIGKQGTLKYPNGDVYTGFFDDGRKQGFGVMVYANGSKYEGRWDNDMREGEGKLFDADTNRYFEGNFTMNKPDGYGKMYWLTKPFSKH